jgi:hypothetical protein
MPEDTFAAITCLLLGGPWSQASRQAHSVHSGGLTLGARQAT